MRLAKGHALARQVIRQLGRIQIAASCRSFCSRFVDAQVSQDGSAHIQAIQDCIHRVEDCFLVFLHIFVVGERQPLHHGQQRRETAKYSARPAFVRDT